MDVQKTKDNPLWPNTSSVARAKDAAAKLPLPKVSDSEWTLSEHDVECLALGAAILASGGGGHPKLGIWRAGQVLNSGKDLKMTNPCRLDASKMGKVCTCAIMGSPSADSKQQGNAGETLAIQRLQQVIAARDKFEVNKKVVKSEDGSSFAAYIANADDLDKVSLHNVPTCNQLTGLTAVETGGINTIQPLIVSALNGLPCLDVAGMGRSYPVLEMFMPFMCGSNWCPASLANDNKESVTCVAVESCAKLEQFFRSLTGNLPSIAMGCIPFEAVFSEMALYASSQAWQLGRAVSRAVNTHDSIVSNILEQQQGMVLITGTVAGGKYTSGAGFLGGYCDVKGTGKYDGYYVRVYAKNENYVAKEMDSAGENAKVKNVLACMPDVVTIVNTNPSTALDVPVLAGNDYIHKVKGQQVAVLVLTAEPHWLYTAAALRIVGPRAVGVDMDYREPQSLLAN